MNQVITIAGTGKEGFKDGNAKDSMFREPMAVCCSNDGRLYITEYDSHRIRMIHDSQVTTIAGNGQAGFRDGNALEAMFDCPMGICISQDGRIYVTDYNNHRIRMIYNDQVTTVAGSGQKGFKDGNALEAMFDHPSTICCSQDGRLYVSNSDIHGIKMIYNGQVTTISRDGQQGFKDGNVLIKSAFSNPWPICCSSEGKLYISDFDKNIIQMIYNNQVTTIAGNGQAGFKDGNALEAMFSNPTGICISKDGRIYIGDYENHRIRMIYNGQVTTIAGTGKAGFKDGNALKSMFNYPNGICCSNDGNLYICDYSNNRIRMIYNDQATQISANQNQIVLQKSPFGFALLLDMKNTFCDCQISFNNITYHLHSVLVNVRCPLLLDQSCFGLLQQSNISNESFEAFLTFLYSNRLTREYNQTLVTTMSMKTVVELIFLFDLFMNSKWILTELKTRFTEQLIEMLTINLQQSMREMVVDLLPCIFKLKELIKTRPNMTNMTTANPSYIEHCYHQLIHESEKRRSLVAQYVPDLQRQLTYDDFASIMKDMMVQNNEKEIKVKDDQAMVEFGAALTELSKLAFNKTNMQNRETRLESSSSSSSSSSISTQHLYTWTTPDFVIKLSNEDVEYRVHKLILCGRWKYFCLMIESGLKEMNKNQMTLGEDWNRSRFEKLMKYIYLNEIDELEDVEWLMGNRN